MAGEPPPATLVPLLAAATTVVSEPPGAALALFADDAPLGAEVPGLLDAAERARLVEAVYRAREEWNRDFDGAQFSLGRAFYTHLETGRSDEYFAGAAESDARVERFLPGVQERMRALVADLVSAHARARRGWCGAGVHVFPAGGEVASSGGVKHFDIEGLNERQVAERRRALSVVLMLQAPERGGGLRLWEARYHGREHATRKDEASRSVVVDYAAGSLVAFDSYRLHQIQPFAGTRDRVSITIHAAEVDPGVWETWF